MNGASWTGVGDEEAVVISQVAGSMSRQHAEARVTLSN